MAGIVVLADIIAPNTLWEAGVTGRNVRRNRRAENQAGYMNINVLWSKTRREFRWGTMPHSVTVWQTLQALFEATDAGAYGFLIKDPQDESASHTTGKASLINAGAHTYQAYKRTTAIGSSPAVNHDRIIKYLDATSLELKIAGVTKTLGVDYTVNDETGVFTIPSDPSASAITWSGPFYVPVHFRDDEIEWELVRSGDEDERLFRGPQIVLQEVKK